MPLVLGFNATHDACAVLLDERGIRLAVEEERLSRVKHHFGLPLRGIQACLDAAGATIDDVEHAAFYMEPGLWLRSFGWHFVKNLPDSLAFTKREPALWKSFLGIERRFRSLTGFRGRFHCVEHHAAHVDSAFFPSGFESAAALTVDGAGEAVTTLLGQVNEGELRRIATARYPYSVGKVWEAVTDWLGWRATEDEGKVMGLAPCGTDRYLDLFREVLRPADPGSDALFHQDLSWFDYPRGNTRLVSERFLRAFGPARRPNEGIAEHHADLARALQAATEDVLLSLAERLRRETGESRLVMAGGVALNCVANGKLVRRGIFDDVFIQPAAGDNGASLGAALHVLHRRFAFQRAPAMRHAFVGPAFTEAETLAAAAERGLVPERPADLIARTADLLAEGRVIGWMQGRMEYGPRALGNRSILADPTEPGMKDRVNARVKFREGFRPFAPAAPLEDASTWFEDVRPSPWMLLAFQVRPEFRDRLPAVTHVDGSARLQTVSAEENPRFHALLRAFGARRGVSVLLNTSFNVRGEPIVCTPGEALDAWWRTGLDAVVIGDLVFTKPATATSAPARPGAHA